MRIRTIIVATLLVGLAACGGGDATTTTGAPTTTSTAVSTTSTTVTPTTSGGTAATTSAPTTVAPTTAAPTTTTTTTAAPGVVIDVVVEAGAVAGRIERVQVSEGDEVTLRVITDIADEVHVHGIDVFFDAGPGENVFTFVADLRGIFEIEFEQSGILLAELQVS